MYDPMANLIAALKRLASDCMGPPLKPIPVPVDGDTEEESDNATSC